MSACRLLPVLGESGKYEQYGRDVTLTLLKIATVTPATTSATIMQEIMTVLDLIVKKYMGSKSFQTVEGSPFSSVLIGMLRALGTAIYIYIITQQALINVY